MNVVIRVDSSSLLGVGHLMRCIALAQNLRGRGSEVSFICRELPGHLSHLAKQASFAVYMLDEIDTGLDDEAFQRIDSRAVSAMLARMKPVDWLIMDHYRLDSRWQKQIRSHTKKLLVIDDLANRTHDCDILVDQGFHANLKERYQGLVPPQSKQFLGPRFALLREPFAAASALRRTRDGRVRRLLVTFGGADTSDAASLAIDAILSLKGYDLHVDLVVGSVYSQAIRERCRHHSNFICHDGLDAEAMIHLMEGADLAICSAGGTTWERCALGLPAIVIAVAENQEPIASSLACDGQAFFLGRQEDIAPSSLAKAVETVMHMPLVIAGMSQRNAKLVDGRGATRVAAEMIIGLETITLRPVTMADSESIYAWRNHPETRRYSHNPEPILPEEHEVWFDEILSDPARVLLVGESSKIPLGVIRYDITGDLASVSFYVVPGQAGQGYGAALLLAGNSWLQRNRPEISKVHGQVLQDNTRSLRAFEKAGFRIVQKEYCCQLNEYRLDASPR